MSKRDHTSTYARSPTEQVKLVAKVKGYENGFIDSPAVMSPSCTVADLEDLKRERNISGEFEDLYRILCGSVGRRKY